MLNATTNESLDSVTPKCSFLEDDNLLKIKQILEEQKEVLRINRESRIEQIKHGHEATKDAADMAGQEADAERLWLFLNRDENIEQRVKKALKRIENGKYGVCMECDSPIAYKRLLIDPTSELCINCKSELELTN